MSLCHTCIIKKHLDGKRELFSESPDEEALVNFSKFCEFNYEGIDEKTGKIKINMNGRTKFYQKIGLFEFSSER